MERITRKSFMLGMSAAVLMDGARSAFASEIGAAERPFGAGKRVPGDRIRRLLAQALDHDVRPPATPVEMMLRAFTVFSIDHSGEYMPISQKGFRRKIREKMITTTVQNALHVVGWRLKEGIRHEWLIEQAERMKAEGEVCEVKFNT